MSDKYDLDEIIPQVIAQLEVHEILVSALYVNWISRQPEAFGIALMNEIGEAGRSLRGRPTGDPDEIEFMVKRQAHINAALARFAVKVLALGGELRARHAAAGNDVGGG